MAAKPKIKTRNSIKDCDNFSSNQLEFFKLDESDSHDGRNSCLELKKRHSQKRYDVLSTFEFLFTVHHTNIN